jgi:hypothetical protein
MSSASDFVCLVDGPIIPRLVLELLMDLELRGVKVSLDGDGLAVEPGSCLTAEDRALIRRYRLHVLAVLSYVHDRMSETVQ